MHQEITLVGNVGKDAEMKFTPQGVEVASFSMATNRKWGNGDDQQKTLWFRVTGWRKLAETIGQYVKKGMKVLVIGELEEPRIWTDNEGNARVSLEVTARTVRFLSHVDDDEGSDRPQSAGRSGQRQNGRSNTNGRQQRQAQSQPDYSDQDDIPF